MIRLKIHFLNDDGFTIAEIGMEAEVVIPYRMSLNGEWFQWSLSSRIDGVYCMFYERAPK